MTIAIPIWEGRISPLFDTAQRILLATIRKEEILDQRVVELPNLTFKECIHFLIEKKVNIIICGAISQPLSKST